MKYSKNLYLDDALPIDAELKAASQNDLRDRIRSGHILHSILGELTISLHDFVRVPEKQRLAALMDLLKHHERMQQRINPKSQKEAKKVEPPAAETTDMKDNKSSKSGKPKHNFSMPGA